VKNVLQSIRSGKKVITIYFGDNKLLRHFSLTI